MRRMAAPANLRGKTWRLPQQEIILILGVRPTSEAWPMSARIAAVRDELWGWPGVAPAASLTDRTAGRLSINGACGQPTRLDPVHRVHRKGPVKGGA